MPHRDRWPPEREREFDRPDRHVERPIERPADRPDDFGQADYSADYAYDPRTRTGYRAHDDREDLNDFGQADYSEDFAYDDRSRTAYRRSDPEMRRVHEDDRYDARYVEPRRDRRDDYDDRGEQRSWMDQARDGVSSLFAPRGPSPERRAREHGQARVTWAVITGRMDHERRLDARDIEVIVDGTEVTLNGTVRSREEKRLAEDVAEIRGITHVQNNLRIGRRGWF